MSILFNFKNFGTMKRLALLAHCALVALLRAAPVTRVGMEGSPQNQSQFPAAVAAARSLSRKLVDAVGRTHAACVQSPSFTLDPSSDTGKWQYMAASLGIPAVPALSPPSNGSMVDTDTLKQIMIGLQLHEGLLKAIWPYLSNREPLDLLQADIKELTEQIYQILELLEEPASLQPPSVNLASGLTDYQVQVALHLTLQQLQSFGHNVFRILRYMMPPEPED
uniref:Uncharacterized protein n=2 Tax=Denticeps clupeoides TaxID=299321 RepID=A0AAY4C589_9TELE